MSLKSRSMEGERKHLLPSLALVRIVTKLSELCHKEWLDFNIKILIGEEVLTATRLSEVQPYTVLQSVLEHCS